MCVCVCVCVQAMKETKGFSASDWHKAFTVTFIGEEGEQTRLPFLPEYVSSLSLSLSSVSIGLGWSESRVLPPPLHPVFQLFQRNVPEVQGRLTGSGQHTSLHNPNQL